jgi:hypothetical protein
MKINKELLPFNVDNFCGIGMKREKNEKIREFCIQFGKIMTQDKLPNMVLRI